MEVSFAVHQGPRKVRLLLEMGVLAGAGTGACSGVLGGCNGALICGGELGGAAAAEAATSAANWSMRRLGTARKSVMTRSSSITSSTMGMML